MKIENDIVSRMLTIVGTSSNRCGPRRYSYYAGVLAMCDCIGLDYTRLCAVYRTCRKHHIPLYGGINDDTRAKILEYAAI